VADDLGMARRDYRGLKLARAVGLAVSEARLHEMELAARLARALDYELSERLGAEILSETEGKVGTYGQG